jgi:hypothetical protein
VVPTEYSTFFTTMAAASATLFGLIFVAISIAPENLTTSNASIERQVRAIAAYIALLNPLMVSLFALVPRQWIGIAVSVLSWIGILNTLAMSVSLFKSTVRPNDMLRSIALMVISLILYGFEAFIAIKISGPVFESYWLSILADVLIFITLFGIVRAWELIGIRHFRIRDWLADLLFRKRKEAGNSGRNQSKG